MTQHRQDPPKRSLLDRYVGIAQRIADFRGKVGDVGQNIVESVGMEPGGGGPVDFPATGRRISAFGNAVSGAANLLIEDPEESVLSVMHRVNAMGAYLQAHPIETLREFSLEGDFRIAEEGSRDLLEGNVWTGLLKFMTAVPGVGTAGKIGKAIKTAFKATSRGARRAATSAREIIVDQGAQAARQTGRRISGRIDEIFEGSTTGRIARALDEPGNIVREEAEIMDLIRADRGEAPTTIGRFGTEAEIEEVMSQMRGAESQGESVLSTMRREDFAVSESVDDAMSRLQTGTRDLLEGDARAAAGLSDADVAAMELRAGQRFNLSETQLETQADILNRRLAERTGSRVATPPKER